MPDAAPATGASELINQPAPIATPEALRADPAFMERVAKMEPEAFAQYNEAWRVAHGLTPKALPPQSMVDVDVEADARVIAAVQQHAEVLERNGYTLEQQIEIVGQRPVTMQERNWHQNQYELRRRDFAFMARWSSGDMEAIKIMRDHAIGKSLPIGTLEEIKAWEGE